MISSAQRDDALAVHRMANRAKHYWKCLPAAEVFPLVVRDPWSEAKQVPVFRAADERDEDPWVSFRPLTGAPSTCCTAVVCGDSFCSKCQAWEALVRVQNDTIAHLSVVIQALRPSVAAGAAQSVATDVIGAVSPCVHGEESHAEKSVATCELRDTLPADESKETESEVAVHGSVGELIETDEEIAVHGMVQPRPSADCALKNPFKESTADGKLPAPSAEHAVELPKPSSEHTLGNPFTEFAANEELSEASAEYPQKDSFNESAASVELPKKPLTPSASSAPCGACAVFADMRSRGVHPEFDHCPLCVRRRQRQQQQQL